MSAFDTLCRGKKGWFVFNCCSSSWSVLFWSHICYDYTRPTLLIWPFSSDMALYYTVTITALLFLPFLSLLLMWDQSVFVHAVWQLSAMFTTPEGEASLSQSRWGGLVHPLPPSLPLPPHFLLNILDALGLGNNNKLIGLLEVSAFVEIYIIFA